MTDENKKKGLSSYIQFKSLRKNYIKYLIELNQGDKELDINCKKIIGHEADITGHYYSRINPKIACDLINRVNFGQKLELFDLRDKISDFYGEIITELDIPDSTNLWEEYSKIKIKKIRKV